MRAGLFSNPQVIKFINDRFVTSWIIKQDLEEHAKKGDKMAQQVVSRLEEPVMDLIFLSSDGQFISRLNCLQDFLDVHPDVTTPYKPRRGKKEVQSDVDVFLEHVAKHLGGD